MKFSYRQILASAAGAVLSAIIASIFGVKGTVVGVAIGSVAATTGTALVLQSIERTNKAVKQVAVRVPNSTKLLRRLGGTDAAGVTETTSGGSSPLAGETATSAAPNDRVVETEGAVETTPLTSPGPADAVEEAAPRRTLRWPMVVGAVVGVFVFALGLVTVVELIVGRPLADIFGHSGGGTTVQRIFETPSTTLPPPTSTTTTTTTSPSTTTSTSSASTSSTSTTTTSLGATTTSTTGPVSSSSTTTTTVPGASGSNSATQSG